MGKRPSLARSCDMSIRGRAAAAGWLMVLCGYSCTAGGAVRRRRHGWRRCTAELTELKSHRHGTGCTVDQMQFVSCPSPQSDRGEGTRRRSQPQWASWGSSSQNRHPRT
ncbi:hypothetical protein KSP39_PZI007425 [Platanthera zijinensis]|uniref:Uncharacterized protein n=1 Tax=Platanthera zijinensis TaxID=2320716 RepID=A0AAP0BPE4_9ASPA